MTIHRWEHLGIPDETNTEVKVPDMMLEAKLIIYALTSSIIKVNPNYFSEEVFVALVQSEKELIKGLRELDEDVSINDLMVNLFSKERMH